MRKMAIFLIALMVVSVGFLSGCEKEIEQAKKLLSVVIEATAHVENSTGAPIEGVEVTFRFFDWPTDTLKVEVRTTDSLGWTPFAVGSLEIKEDWTAWYEIYLTQDRDIGESNSVSYDHIKNNSIDGVYYWSVSPRFVLED